MFKYKSTPILLIHAFIFISVFIFIVNKTSEKDILRDNNLMKNNIKFSGTITNLNVSGSHDFGILQLKIAKTNNRSFNSPSENKKFPYAIKDSLAEVYTTVPIPELKKGFNVFVNSNNRTISIYDGKKFLYEWEIHHIT